MALLLGHRRLNRTRRIHHGCGASVRTCVRDSLGYEGLWWSPRSERTGDLARAMCILHRTAQIGLGTACSRSARYGSRRSQMALRKV